MRLSWGQLIQQRTEQISDHNNLTFQSKSFVWHKQLEYLEDQF